MAVDLQVVFPQEVIPITSVRRVQGSNPPVLEVLGHDFSAIDEVKLNDMPIEHYVVVSRNRLLITLPDGLEPVQSVSVTSSRLVLSERSFLKFRLGAVPSKVAGVLRLMQLFVKILLTNAGSDIFNKKLGAGALRGLGSTFSQAEISVVVSDFVVAVDNAVRQIVAIQSRQPQLPSDERLLSAKVVSAHFDAGEAALLVSVELTSHAGRSALARMAV